VTHSPLPPTNPPHT